MAQHHVEAAGQEVRAGLAAVALHQADPVADPLRLTGERLLGDRQHPGILLQPGHLVPGAGQPQRLRPLAHAHVEYPQPLPHGEALRDLLVDLPAHELLTDRVAQSAQALEPQACPLGEASPDAPGAPPVRAVPRA